MTSSAPIDRTRSSFDVLATPVTRAPNAFAICTANVPTPPAAPTTSTDCPGWTRASSRTAWSAVTPETGTAAACSKVSLAGLGTSLSARAIANSAKEPGATPITSSPGWNVVTFAPTASTVPATSHPRTRSFGPPNPITGRAMYGCPVIRCHTSGPAPAACTRTSTSLSPTTGSSTSCSLRTSAEPYVSCTIAFIATPPSRCTPYTCWRYPSPERVLSARRAFLRHPWASRVIESRTAPTPTVIGYMDEMIGILRKGGFSVDLTHHAMHAIGSRALGFSQELFDDTPDDPPEIQAIAAHEMAAAISHDDASVVGQGCDDQFEFEFALDLMLEGLDRLRRTA